ncbi:MAG: hypothetical protein MI923_10935 [Phycisphaerales bacterium]|nr:hypothetical protein [Phycisphaerales bacterium]
MCDVLQRRTIDRLRRDSGLPPFVGIIEKAKPPFHPLRSLSPCVAINRSRQYFVRSLSGVAKQDRSTLQNPHSTILHNVVVHCFTTTCTKETKPLHVGSFKTTN